MENKLIKIDRNGSKHWEGLVTCDRCGGTGIFAYCVRNGVIIPTIVDHGVCHKCHGRGKILGKWIERTAEYQAKLDAKRQEAIAKEQARLEAERAERIKAEEERQAKIRAQKAISQYVGNVGDKVELKATYVMTAEWSQRSFTGFGVVTMKCHIFKDPDGNVIVWKTESWFKDSIEYGEPVIIKGTVKEHKEYKEEKQTVMTRCSIKRVRE